MDVVVYFALIILALSSIIWGQLNKLLVFYLFGSILMMALGGSLAISATGNFDSVIGGVVALFGGLLLFDGIRHIWQ